MPLKRTVVIETSFASEYQRDIAMYMLNEILEVWKETIEQNDTNNIVIITRGEASRSATQ